jgi:hypothetical protein
VAEDAAVLDLLRRPAEVGVGTGGNPSAFRPSGWTATSAAQIFARKLQAAAPRPGAARRSEGSGQDRLYPAAPQLLEPRLAGHLLGGRRRRAGRGRRRADALAHPAAVPRCAAAQLDELQNPIIDAYLTALPAGHAPRILGSRTCSWPTTGARRCAWPKPACAAMPSAWLGAGKPVRAGSLAELLAATDTHAGTPADVIESLATDRSLDRATDVAFQVHSVDPPPALILRSIELIATEVAPALGWRTAAAPSPASTHLHTARAAA